jgi:hypothetical protein
MLSEFDPSQIEDEGTRQAIVGLMNLVEALKQENEALRAEVQRLRDEIKRLKGEQGQPQMKAGKKKGSNYSSEAERGQAKGWRKGSKVDQIKIDREEKLVVARTSLPADAEFKGYEAVVVQDLSIKTDNIRFLKERYYSASQQMSYSAPLPAGYQGQFGPGIRALVLVQYYSSGMSEPKIQEFLANFGVQISAGQISNLLTKNQGVWQGEKDEIYQAGLSSSGWQHIDETGTRVDGANHFCHIICNPLYTAYFTRPHKDRLTVISLLQNRPELQFLLNPATIGRLADFASPQWVQHAVRRWPQDFFLSQTEIHALVQRDLARLNPQQQARVYVAAALSAYDQQTTVPVVPILLSDEARQYEAVTQEQALCWVHEGRHYKKLSPYLAHHRQVLTDFLTQFWDFYHRLQDYRADPTPAQAQTLRAEFQTLFSPETGYTALDTLIAKTKAKQAKLLMVLDYPDIPLHNNPAELGARQRVRKRDVSFGPRTDEGAAAWDTFQTLAATAQKLGVSFFAYVFDRVADLRALPALADLIRQRTPVAHPISRP